MSPSNGAVPAMACGSHARCHRKGPGTCTMLFLVTNYTYTIFGTRHSFLPLFFIISLFLKDEKKQVLVFSRGCSIFAFNFSSSKLPSFSVSIPRLKGKQLLIPATDFIIAVTKNWMLLWLWLWWFLFLFLFFLLLLLLLLLWLWLWLLLFFFFLLLLLLLSLSWSWSLSSSFVQYDGVRIIQSDTIGTIPFCLRIRHTCIFKNWLNRKTFWPPQCRRDLPLQMRAGLSFWRWQHIDKQVSKKFACLPFLPRPWCFHMLLSRFSIGFCRSFLIFRILCCFLFWGLEHPGPTLRRQCLRASSIGTPDRGWDEADVAGALSDARKIVRSRISNLTLISLISDS